MRMKLKLHRSPVRTKIKARFDTKKLENKMSRSKLSVELSNIFKVLKKYQQTLYTGGEGVHKKMRKSIRPSKTEQQVVVGRGHLESNGPAAITHDKIHSTKSEGIKGKLRLEYTLKDREVKRRETVSG